MKKKEFVEWARKEATEIANLIDENAISHRSNYENIVRMKNLKSHLVQHLLNHKRDNDIEVIMAQISLLDSIVTDVLRMQSIKDLQEYLKK